MNSFNFSYHCFEIKVLMLIGKIIKDFYNQHLSIIMNVLMNLTMTKFY